MTQRDDKTEKMEAGDLQNETSSSKNAATEDDHLENETAAPRNEEDDSNAGENSEGVSHHLVLGNAEGMRNSGTQAAPANGDHGADKKADFWIPPPYTKSDTTDDFRIITFKEQEKATIWSRLPHYKEILSGWAQALVVVVVGLLLMLYSDKADIEEEIKNCLLQDGSEQKDWKTARRSFYRLMFGEVFFDAAVVASYELFYKMLEAGLMIAWSFVANKKPRSKGKDTFHLKDFLQIIPVAIFFIIGVPLLTPEEAGSQLNWGKVLFATGLIYIAIRAMFFVPQPDDEIRRLQSKVEELETSVALGLADGYFFNFLWHVLKDVKSEHDRSVDKTRITYKDGPTENLNIRCFVVAVPRNIDWSPNFPITAMIKYYKERSCAFDCHVGPANQKSGFRPQMVYVDHESEETQKISVLFDVPTTLQVITRNIRDNRKLKTKEERDNQYHLEMNRFTYRLAWRAYKMGVGEYVRIVEVDNPIPEDDLNLSLVGIIRHPRITG